MPGGSRRVLVIVLVQKERGQQYSTPVPHAHTCSRHENVAGRRATTDSSMACIMRHESACTWRAQLQPAATNPDSSGPCQLMQAHQEGQTAHTGFAPGIFQHFNKLVKRSAKQPPNQSTNQSLAAIFQDGLHTAGINCSCCKVLHNATPITTRAAQLPAGGLC